jgi:DNA-binding GntR family transcriptional regulator
MITKNQKTTKLGIYRRLRRTIITGQPRPGQRLNVECIAEKYGTSVSPVRDALHMLAQEGLITIRPRSGYFGTRMTLKQLADLLEMLEILEMAGIERAGRGITARQLEELERVHAGYTGDEAGSYERYTDENRRFHVLLAGASGNEVLAEVLGHLLDRLARFMVLRRGGDCRSTPSDGCSKPCTAKTSPPRAGPCWRKSAAAGMESWRVSCATRPGPGTSRNLVCLSMA